MVNRRNIVDATIIRIMKVYIVL